MDINAHVIFIIYFIITKPPQPCNSFYYFLEIFMQKLSKKLCILFFISVLYYGRMDRVGSPDRTIFEYFAGVF